MSAHLSLACACGRVASTPCPTVADIPAAQSRLTGWGYDGKGFVRCAACLSAGAVAAPVSEPTHDQLNLFAEVQA